MQEKSATRKYFPYLLLLGSLLFYFLYMLFPSFFAAVYTRGVYSVVSRVLSWCIALIPFSLGEFCVVVLICIFAVWLVKGIYLLIVNRVSAKIFWKKRGGKLLRGGAYALSLFIWFAGVNYLRPPLAQDIGLTVAPATKEELMDLCVHLRTLANAAAEEVSRNASGELVPESTFSQKKATIQEAYDSLATAHPQYKGAYPSIKPLMLSRYVSYFYIMGMYFPFTLEANINKDIPDFMIPAVMGHEQAHIRGFMREEEAEFSMFLLSRYTENRALRYSCYLSTLMRAMGPLYRADIQLRDSLVKGFSLNVKRDVVAYINYWDSFQSNIGAISGKLNDAYLRANGQSDGVHSYGRVVDLLMADFKKNKKP